MNGPFRIGQIVPSSNLTMESEIPALLRTRCDFCRTLHVSVTLEAGFETTAE